MKRFVETEKWNDGWFRRLSPDLKLLWDYLYTRCDNAGVWDVDWELTHFHTGVAYQQSEVVAAFGDRVRDIGHGKWWLPKFVSFQFGELSLASRVHQSVIALMKKRGVYTLWIAYARDSLSIPHAGGIHTPKEKDKVQDKDKEKDSGKGSGENLSTGEMPSLEQVKAAVMTTGIPDGFVELVYSTWQQRSGKDGAGVAVEIIPYVRNRWVKEQADWRSGMHRGQQQPKTVNHAGNKRHGGQSVDRNAGTANAGKTSGYSAAAARKAAL